MTVEGHQVRATRIRFSGLGSEGLSDSFKGQRATSEFPQGHVGPGLISEAGAVPTGESRQDWATRI